MIPPETIEQVREATDIVDLISHYIALKPAGKGFKGLCPFHHEKTPSFTVNADRQFFHCFGCKAGGNAFHFLMRAEGMTFVEAVKELAQRAHVVLPESDSPGAQAQENQRRQLLEVMAWAAGRFQEALQRPKVSEPAQRYLQKRGVGQELARQFGLGYAPDGWDNLMKAAHRDHFSEGLLEKAGLIVPRSQGEGFYDRFRHRVMFPIRDLQGRTVAFGGRLLEPGEPKYLNSPETQLFKKGEMLFGLDLARETARKKNRVLLVEGYMDVMACHAFGFSEAVASLGTALTPGQASLIRRFAEKVIIGYDADDAGVAATLRAFEILNREGLLVQMVTLPSAKDPDEFLRAQGAEAFEALLEHPLNAVEFVFNQVAKKEALDRLEGKLEVLKRLAPVVAQMTSPVERSVSLRWIADRLRLDENTVKEELGRQKRPPAAPIQAPAAPAAAEKRPARAEEKILIGALLRRPSLVAKFHERLRADFFNDEILKALAERLIAHDPVSPDAEEDWTPGWIHGLPEPAWVETALTLWAENRVPGQTVAAAEDCLNRLEAAWLRDQIRDLQAKLSEAQAAGEREAFKQMAQNEIEMKNRLKKLGVDWGRR